MFKIESYLRFVHPLMLLHINSAVKSVVDWSFRAHKWEMDLSPRLSLEAMLNFCSLGGIGGYLPILYSLQCKMFM